MKPLVRILVTVPDEASFDSCTLVFDTLRIGFPTAEIRVDVNPVGYMGTPEGIVRLKGKAYRPVSMMGLLPTSIHHAEWLEWRIEGHQANQPLIILDADTIFWKSVEDWDFSGSLMAGYYVPEMWNDFAKCRSFSRIHTSFMWFNNVPKLRGVIKSAYPQAFEAAGGYCPCNPFMPDVKFFGGEAHFWDSTSNLYQMVDKLHVRYFGQPELDCYEHLNSASFFDVMRQRLDKPGSFELVHRELVKTPEKLRGQLWPVVDAYYQRKQIQGHA